MQISHFPGSLGADREEWSQWPVKEDMAGFRKQDAPSAFPVVFSNT